MSKRVLFIHAQGYSGGVQAMFDLYREMNRSSLSLECFLGYFGKNSSAQEKNVYDNQTFFWEYHPLNPMLPLVMSRTIRKYDIDIIYTHGPAAHMMLSFINLFIKKTLVIHLHGDFRDDAQGYGGNSFLKQKLRKILFTKVPNAFITVSEDKKSILEKDYSIPPSRIFPIPNGIRDLSTIPSSTSSPEHIKRQYSIREDEFLVLNVGSLSPRKNQLAILSLAEKAKSLQLPMKFLLIGDGSQRSYLETEIKRRRISQYVVLLGNIPRNAIQDWYRISNVYVSTAHSEGMPLTFLEAMSCRLPIVSYTFPGIEEVLPYEELTEEMDNVDGVFQKLYDFYLSPKRRHYFGETLRNDFIQNFTLETQVNRIGNLLEEIDSQHKR